MTLSRLFLPVAMLTATACASSEADHGPIAAGISSELGQPMPSATAEQREAFERGRRVAIRRFELSEGLGPVFNATFCGSCHEKPVFGGSAGLYRNFFLVGQRLEEDGPFFPGHAVSLFDCGDTGTVPRDRVRNPPPESLTGVFAGVLRIYGYGEGISARPAPDAELNVFAQRNPIPFFGVGLLAELPAEEIERRADPEDRDGDGISGRVNIDRGFVGRFGRKSQTVSIEGFIRGPLYNHLGITTDPLSEELRARLPVDSSLSSAEQATRSVTNALFRHAQAAAPSGPNCDLDDTLDPEMEAEDLFDLVSFTMLLGAPELEPLNEQRRRGLKLFDAAGCQSCHTPRLTGPRGPLPVYSDLLLHDMGAALADGIEMGEASGREYRTQPLWGIGAVGPYLHDGRAHTLSEAILLHGGEAEQSRDRFERLSDAEEADLIEFLLSLGGRSQTSLGLLPPAAPVPPVGEVGGPLRDLSVDEEARFVAGRALFDRDFGLSEGAGGPRLNGDSCRACHFDPVIGGAGPRGVNVIRHGIAIGDTFVPPRGGTILHKVIRRLRDVVFPQPQASIFEHRQTPAVFGVGLIQGIPEANVLANVDAGDDNDDGISGRAHFTGDGRLGRFGWKAQVPSIGEFVRDAAAAELGLTIEETPGLSFGATEDGDGIDDPELSRDDAALMEQYMLTLAPPPRKPAVDPEDADAGEVLFADIACGKCHIPALDGADGPVALFSDLLLHDMLPDGLRGIVDGMATEGEFRTPPLWGISDTAPYMHSGAADSLEQAILLHDGEARGSRDAFVALTPAEQSSLLAFLGTL